MAKFKTIDDVKRAFKSKANGSDQLERHPGFRFSDIDKYAPIIEALMETDYNKINGMSAPEMFEAISYLHSTLKDKNYLNKANQYGAKISESIYNNVDLAACEDNFFTVCSEAFEGTTAQQAPYPVPSISFVTYRYEKSILPFVCHLYDLKGNRGIIYFQRITATNSQGNIVAGDLLGDPRKFPKQPVGFATTKVDEVLGALATGETEKTVTLTHVPQPGSLNVYIDGHVGHFHDYQANMAKEGIAILTAVDENLGQATFDYATKKLNVNLNDAAVQDGLQIRVIYNRDVELAEAGDRRIAKLTMDVDTVKIDTENVSIMTECNIYQEQLAKAIFGVEWNDELDRMLGTFFNKEMGDKAVSEIRAAIPTANIFSHDITATLNTTGTGDNKIFNTQFLALVLGVLKKKVNKSSGIKPNKFTSLVVNIDLLPVFEGLPKFTSSVASTEDVMGGMYLGGMYDGIPVIIAFEPIVGENEVIALYKSQTQDFLTPYGMGTFMEPIVREVLDHRNTAINVKEMMATIGGKVLCPNLTAKLIVENVDKLLGITEVDG